jgi:dihydrofolate reductase
MRTLKLQVQISIDGFIAGPNGEMDWMTWNWDDSLKEYVGKLTEPLSTIVLGRKLAEGFIPYWEQAAQGPEPQEGSEKLSSTPKVVFTKTLNDTGDWKDTVLAKGNLEDEIAKLKAEDGGDIIAYGGGTFVASLIKANLIDEYHLFVNPVAVGSGMPIFNTLDTKRPLQLVKASGFDCGITVLHYKKA